MNLLKFFRKKTSTNNNNKKKNTMTDAKKQVVNLLNSIETGDQSAGAAINPEKYIQHNTGVADGIAGFGQVLQALPPGSAKVAVKRVFQDGDYVFTHTDYNFFGPKVGFDIFRFENSKIVEHWDNLAEKTKPNPSGRTQIDGETESTDLDKTESNKKIVQDFLNQVLVGGAFDKLPAFINAEKYLQHNSGIADGLDGLGKGIEELAKQGINMVYSKIHKVLGEGNFVLTISEGTFGPDAVSYYDLFRLENNLIVEHWDVIEKLAPESEHKNKNGKFNF